MSYQQPERLNQPPLQRGTARQEVSPGLRPMSGLLAGTEVLTRGGFRRVETLCSGEHVITRDRGLCRLTSVVPVQARSRMVRFSPAALGDDAPAVDLLLPAHQRVLVRDWRAAALFGKHEARVPAAALIDDGFITDDGVQDLCLLQVLLESPAVLYSRGLELLSTHGFDSEMAPHL